MVRNTQYNRLPRVRTCAIMNTRVRVEEAPTCSYAKAPTPQAPAYQTLGAYEIESTSNLFLSLPLSFFPPARSPKGATYYR